MRGLSPVVAGGLSPVVAGGLSLVVAGGLYSLQLWRVGSTLQLQCVASHCDGVSFREACTLELRVQ